MAKTNATFDMKEKNLFKCKEHFNKWEHLCHKLSQKVKLTYTSGDGKLTKKQDEVGHFIQNDNPG